MDSVTIQNYKSENFEDVKRIYSSGQKEQITKGVYLGLQNHFVIGYLTFLFVIGSYFSIFYGLFALSVGLYVQAGSVYSFYTLYIREVFINEFYDENLEYWTTSPNTFLVAKSTESGKTIGFVSYVRIDLYTVQLNRLAVDQDFRQLKIGEKLVKTLIDVAIKNGYNTMYLDTSEPQKAGQRLYEKLGFRYLRSLPMMVFGINIGLLCGLKDVAYLKRI